MSENMYIDQCNSMYLRSISRSGAYYSKSVGLRDFTPEQSARCVIAHGPQKEVTTLLTTLPAECRRIRIEDDILCRKTQTMG